MLTNNSDHVIVLIPAYKPDKKLIQLIEVLKAHTVLVVDDGSGDAFAELFTKVEELGALLLSYPENKGKGYALKYGFQWISEHRPNVKWIITADADGQHMVSDIRKLMSGLQQDSDTVLRIGVRKFSGYVPLRSRVGNAVASWLFEKITGVELADTQSGLRAYNAGYLEVFLDISGERYEYEMNCLLYCAIKKKQMEQILIDTVYERNNISSHFRVAEDTLKIFKVMVTGRLNRKEY